MEYSEYLLTEHWKNTRNNFLLNHKNQCSVCSATSNLHIHHKRYRKPILHESIIGKEKNSHLCILCNQCHSTWHGIYGKKEMNSKFIKNAKQLYELGASRKKAFLFCTQIKVIEEILHFANTKTDLRVNRYI